MASRWMLALGAIMTTGLVAGLLAGAANEQRPASAPAAEARSVERGPAPYERVRERVPVTSERVPVSRSRPAWPHADAVEAGGDPPPAPDPADAPALDDEERRERARVERALHRRVIDERIASEPRDPTWSNRTEHDLDRSLDQVLGEGSSVRDLRCTGSLCRVVLEHESIEAQQAAFFELGGRPGFHLAGRADLEVDDAGRMMTYIYLAREGAEDALGKP